LAMGVTNRSGTWPDCNVRLSHWLPPGRDTRRTDRRFRFRFPLAVYADGSGKRLSAVVERSEIRRAIGWSDGPPVHEKRWIAGEVVDSNGVGAMGCSDVRRVLQESMIDHLGLRSIVW